jgi:deazaflavin-dependent oxidoreductase (nitroreductase family)
LPKAVRLGGRFVLLKHTGRRSGVVRQTVLEVVDHDDAFAQVVVCSGWGERSDWYRNVSADPSISFESKGSVTMEAMEERIRSHPLGLPPVRLNFTGSL